MQSLQSFGNLSVLEERPKRARYTLGMRNIQLRLALLFLPKERRILKFYSKDKPIDKEYETQLLSNIRRMIDPTITTDALSPFYKIIVHEPIFLSNMRISEVQAYSLGWSKQLEQPIIGNLDKNGYSPDNERMPDPFLIKGLLKYIMQSLDIPATNLLYKELFVMTGVDLMFALECKKYANEELMSLCWCGADLKLQKAYIFLSSNTRYYSLVHELVHLLQPPKGDEFNFFREASAEYLSDYLLNYTGEREKKLKRLKERFRNSPDEIAITVNEMLLRKEAFYDTSIPTILDAGYLLFEYIGKEYGIPILWKVAEEMSMAQNKEDFIQDKKRIGILDMTKTEVADLLVKLVKSVL